MLSLINRRANPNFEDVPSVFRLFDETMDRWLTQSASTRPWSPAVDIVENDQELVIHADLPGVKMEDVEVSLEDGTLILAGTRKFEGEANKDGYHRIERSYGSFRRAFTLPDSVDPEKVSAAMDNGVLKIVLPKKELARPRSIKVEVAKK